MLAIRYLRSGRKNQAFFRIVLTEKSKPPKSNFIKVFGWYNPKTKETSLKKEEILEWVDKGAKPSNSVAKLLIANGVTHKQIVFIPDAPKKKKSKEEPKAKPNEANAEEAKQPESDPEKPETEEIQEKGEPVEEIKEKPRAEEEKSNDQSQE